jgi:hypothetical protein
VQAQILGDSATASLMFQDQSAAHELLRSLRYSPDLRLAAIYTPTRRLFAVQGEDADAATAPTAAARDLV